LANSRGIDTVVDNNRVTDVGQWEGYRFWTIAGE